ncbi:MAG: amidohydrolase family protein [Victivallaceae bacterium]|nr:amidohydrolase family protein [Victivallaceae bacterium]
MKLVIKNALIYDGGGSRPFSGTVVCVDGIIKLVAGGSLAVPAGQVYDARGLALTPGFIDAHSHSDISILAAPEAAGKISQGITTEIIGNCGLSVYPVTKHNREHLQEFYRSYNVEISWTDLNGYRAELARRRPAADIVPLSGHNTLRAALCGYGKHRLSNGELRQLQALLAADFDQGAAGLSTGLLYVPGKFADFSELSGLLTTVARYDRVYTTHLRSEGNLLLESVNETLAAARQAGLKRVHLSHLKVAGAANWHKIDELLILLEAAQNAGFELTADRYPYTESLTQLSTMLPEPYSDLDDLTLTKTLQNDSDFARVETVLKALPAERWQTVRLVAAAGHEYERFYGQSLAAAAAALNQHPATLSAEILRAGAAGAAAAFQGMNEANLRRLIRLDTVACGTDESARPADYSLGRSHPRGFGSTARFCNILREEGLPPEQIIRRLTSLPAQIFRLPGKGRIKAGYAADLVLLDPDEFSDTATFAAPHQLTRGIRRVWRRGELIYSGS